MSASETAPLQPPQPCVDEPPNATPRTSETIPNVLGIPLRWTGFTKRYNLFLFLFTAGLFSAFCIFSLPSLDYETWLSRAGPGEPFWFKDGLMKVGMTLHLWSVLPAGALLPLQFVPALRRRYTYMHKLNGRLLLVLLMMGNLTALTIAPKSFSGTITTRAAVILLASLTTVSTYKSWTAIRNLHIDQHRAWILRTWAYAGSILTMRFVMAAIAISVTVFCPDRYKVVTTCQEILFMYNEPTSSDLFDRYPSCSNITSSSEPVYVIANASMKYGYPEESAAILGLAFGVSSWIAQVIHILAVEVYLNLTKDEDERLKRISVLRRKAARLE